MKVYVIEQGEYSDRHVIGVVETEEEAKRICNIIDPRGYDIEYTEFDTTKFKDTRFRFIVKETNRGWTAECNSWNLSGYAKGYVKSNQCICEGEYMVYANSKEQAIKIAQDMKAELLAEKEGIKV